MTEDVEVGIMRPQTAIFQKELTNLIKEHAPNMTPTEILGSLMLAQVDIASRFSIFGETDDK